MSESLEISAFDKDTRYRMFVEACRFWVIEHHQRTKELPDPKVLFVYSDGPQGIGWGNPPGPSGDGYDDHRPLRGKRIRVTVEIEDH